MSLILDFKENYADTLQEEKKNITHTGGRKYV